MTPPATQARRMRKGVWTWRGTTDGVMKMPEPMMPPMKSIAAPKGPRRRASCSCCGSGTDRCHDLIPAAAVLERFEAEMPGHEDAAAVGVEGARGIDVEVALPVEAAAAVAHGEADLAALALEAHLGRSPGVLRHRQAPLDLRLPLRVRAQLRLLVVGDAEVSVLDGVDEELGQADDGGLGIGTRFGEDGAEVAGLVDGAVAEDRVLREAERLHAALELRLQSPDLAVVRRRGAHDHAQQLGVVRLGEGVVRAGVDAFAHVLAADAAGLQDDGDGAAARVGLEARQELEAVHARHGAVEEDDVEFPRVALEHLPRLDAVAGEGDVGGQRMQMRLQECAVESVVLDDEDARLL